MVVQHLPDHRQRVVLEPGLLDGKGQPYAEPGVGLLQSGDGPGTPLARREAVERRSLDVEVDRLAAVSQAVLEQATSRLVFFSPPNDTMACSPSCWSWAILELAAICWLAAVRL